MRITPATAKLAAKPPPQGTLEARPLAEQRQMRFGTGRAQPREPASRGRSSAGCPSGRSTPSTEPPRSFPRASP
eukprot:9076913-Pyramimonas_sp.AAC.1